MDPGGQVTLENLSLWFLHSLSPQPEPRRKAEEELSRAADSPGFSIAVLHLVSSPASDDQIRHAAAVHFKNHLRSRWSPAGDGPSPIPDAEKEQVKGLLVGLMLASPPRIQSQLSEALAVVSSHDFPRSWPALLPELVSSLRSAPDYRAANGLLGAANSIFKKFRSAFGGRTDIRLDLKYCLDVFAAPLLETFLKTARQIDTARAAPAPDAPLLRQMLDSQRLCCRIFYSLNSIELPEFFEDHMQEWMTEFKAYLTTSYPPAVEADGTVDTLYTTICENRLTPHALIFYSPPNLQKAAANLRSPLMPASPCSVFSSSCRGMQPAAPHGDPALLHHRTCLLGVECCHIDVESNHMLGMEFCEKVLEHVS
uniref:Exportin-2 n=1 Tax=Anthurium amnicola TaxID=1678845 RepID=A0A1D1YL62_9ARAE